MNIPPYITCANPQVINQLAIRDPDNRYPITAILDLWAYFRNYDPVGRSFGNLPPLGSIGRWAMLSNYNHLTLYASLVPFFRQLCQFQNGQIFWISNDIGEGQLIMGKNGNTFPMLTLDLSGSDEHQDILDAMFVEANDSNYFKRWIWGFVFQC